VETHQQQLVLTSSVEAIHVFMGTDERRKKTREMTRPGLLREEKKRERTCPGLKSNKKMMRSGLLREGREK
jgi:hypothetical protein